MANTVNFNWILPTVGGDIDVWGSYLNENLNSQDTLVRKMINNFISAVEPTEKQSGTIWLDSSTSPYALKIYDGTGWASIGTLDPVTHTFNANSNASTLVGDMKFSVQGANHNGWILCNGQSLSTTTYSGLFALINYSFGGSGVSFQVPDMRGRVAGAIGTGSGLTARTLGEEVGEETHTLTESEIAIHGHSFVLGVGTLIFPLQSGGLRTTQTSQSYPPYSGTASDTAGQQIGGNTGGGGAHNNMQPTLFVGNYFIYSGV